jgi:hypothetical protein
MPDRFSEEDADGMLDGGPLPPALAALRSPAHPAELHGEEAAVAAFRAARTATPPRTNRRARLVGRALTVKVLVAGAVLAGSGLAVAAATGTLPGPFPITPAATDPAEPGRVVHDRPTREPHPRPPAPHRTAPPPATPGASAPGPGNGNGWGQGHGTGKPSKEPKPPKPPKPSKTPKDNPPKPPK